MAVIVKTLDPASLLTNIKKAIDAKEIQTWSYDSDGDFTHTPEQWQFRAWLRPKQVNGELQFGFIGNENVVTTKLIYAVFHGRFAEMLLNHFDDKLSTIETTAMPTSIDNITYDKDK